MTCGAHPLQVQRPTSDHRDLLLGRGTNGGAWVPQEEERDTASSRTCQGRASIRAVRGVSVHSFRGGVQTPDEPNTVDICCSRSRDRHRRTAHTSTRPNAGASVTVHVSGRRPGRPVRITRRPAARARVGGGDAEQDGNLRWQLDVLELLPLGPRDRSLGRPRREGAYMRAPQRPEEE